MFFCVSGGRDGRRPGSAAHPGGELRPARQNAVLVAPVLEREAGNVHVLALDAALRDGGVEPGEGDRAQFFRRRVALLHVCEADETTATAGVLGLGECSSHCRVQVVPRVARAEAHDEDVGKEDELFTFLALREWLVGDGLPGGVNRRDPYLEKNPIHRFPFW